MSDLVERLRKLTGDVPPRGHVVLAEEAADRIEALENALREARQYVSDAGGDEDSETHRHSASLLIVIDAALAPEQDK